MTAEERLEELKKFESRNTAPDQGLSKRIRK